MTGQFIRRKCMAVVKKAKEIPPEIQRQYVKSRVKSRDFTVISNNCWAGSLYRYFDLPYLSPTAGLYFFADDYLKFITDLHHYIEQDMRFIPADKSKYADELQHRNQLHVPIGVLDDVEIVFLHYKTEQEAKEKWVRRAKKINWDNLFIKFSRMNLCTDEHIERFCQLPYRNKFVLNIYKKTKFDCEYYWIGEKNNDEIIRDTTPFPGNLSLIDLFEKRAEHYPESGLR